MLDVYGNMLKMHQQRRRKISRSHTHTHTKMGAHKCRLRLCLCIYDDREELWTRDSTIRSRLTGCCQRTSNRAHFGCSCILCAALRFAVYRRRRKERREKRFRQPDFYKSELVKKYKLKDNASGSKRTLGTIFSSSFFE